ncbi:hypothetical protein CTAYLR_009834 [Chrysophaeum taylorii]|uniref:Glucose-6-phosphate isomerase n=1 Tax=Chrysophaeum taylorii TaxID=2483200 RepID=A0AAD7XHH2_9STRA|nr:hypothetical protein CTAYLR_009834 [Chrysophaeum taylorii]
MVVVVSESPEYKAIEAWVAKGIPHLRELLGSPERNAELRLEAEGMVMDYARQRLTPETMGLLFALARATGVEAKRDAMFGGVKINETEGRAVYHVALRAAKGEPMLADGVDQEPLVQSTLEKIATFSEAVRSGSWVGATGKPLTSILAIGIGGSYLGPEFLYEALKAYPKIGKKLDLRFLANVDPVDFARQTVGLDPETTLAVVVSKSFTTAETMMNANVVKRWLLEKVPEISKHVVAVSTQLDLTTKFGISEANVFPFGDYVGGRFSVHSPVGMLPLALAYGYDACAEFLAGARSMDRHFMTAPLESNLPVVLGLLGLYNSTFLGYACKALLPYSQALVRFAAHVQQLDCESNGKSVAMDGTPLPFETGEIVFGEPGTNGQHSFYQLLHQGRVVPCEFVAFASSNADVAGIKPISNHDELMCNFFAQPDALACGQDDPDPHKRFPGNRPSLSILVRDQVSPFTMGQLLALYEHRVAVQGFVWGINSFDQWGVQLGKVLAKQVAKAIESKDTSAFNSSTKALLDTYLKNKK